MDEDVKAKIKAQLSLKVNILFCKHSTEKACKDCLSGIEGDVSGIRGNVSGIRGDVSGIEGNVSDIIRILKGDVK